MRNRKIAVGIFTLFLFVSGTTMPAYGCGCGSGSKTRSVFEIATGELNRATAVFSGKVVRFEWRKGIANASRLDHNRRFGSPLDWETKVAILTVDKWWKPSLPEEAVLVTDETRMADGTGGNSSCNYHFVEGKTYLVFAFGPESELRTHSCSATRPLDRVSKEFLDALGRGNDPVKKFEAEKPKLISWFVPAPSVLIAD